MKELTRMKRITNLRDDLIEEAYLSDAIPVIPVSSFLPTPASGFVMGHAAKIAAAAVAGVLSVGVLVGAGLLAYKEWREPIVPPPVTTETTSDETQEPITEPPTHAEETESRKEEPVTDTEPVTETATETEPDTEIQLDVELQPETIQPGETVTVTVTAVVPAELEWVPCFSVYFTYGTVPVGKDILSYAPDESGAGSFTVQIPSNAPAGAYDLTVVCEGTEQVKVFHRVLTVEAPLVSDEKKKDITCLNDDIRVTPYYVNLNGGVWRYSEEEGWSCIIFDGLAFYPIKDTALPMIPTVVYNGSFEFCYGEDVFTEFRSYQILDGEREELSLSGSLAEKLNSLESGVYYIVTSETLHKEDYTEECRAWAKAQDELWADTYETECFEKNLAKNPYYYVTYYHRQYTVRVIIP